MIKKLNSLYHMVKDLDISDSTIDKFIDDNKIISFIDKMAYGDNVDIKELELIIQILQFIYNNRGEGVTPVPDFIYDILYSKYKDITDKDIVGAPIPISKMTVRHNYPELRGTLDKIHFITEKERGDDSRPSIEYWLRQVQKSLNVRDMDMAVYVEPKWDGNSIILELDEDGYVERALTRGDTETNEAVDLTNIFGGLLLHILDEPCGVKTEIVMSDEQFEKANTDIRKFVNKRSAVSGILNNKDATSDMLEYLTIKILSIQTEKGVFYDPKDIGIDTMCDYYDLRFISSVPEKDIIEFLNGVRNKAENEGFLTDGVVVTLVSPKYREILGRKNNINKFQFAFKFKAPSTKSTLLGVDFSYGSSGTLTPVAKIIPVEIGGKIIKSISLGSTARFKMLNLALGDQVIIDYEIIPYLRVDNTCKRSGATPIKMPTTCMQCGERLFVGSQTRCTNPSCSSNVLGKIVNYLEKMSIPNISDATVVTLLNNNIISTIEDLYSIRNKRKDITAIKGFGEKAFANIVDSIESRMKVDVATLLGSLSIDSAGRRIFKKISNIYYIDEIKKICKNNESNKLTLIEGIGDKISEKIIEGINMNENLIDFLCTVLEVTENKGGETKSYDMTVCFTGVRDKEFEKYLDTRGVAVASYSNKVDILIIKDYDVTNAKTVKAENSGKKIISLEDAYKMFSYKKL